MEIAQESYVASPVIQALFTGVALDGRSTRGNDNRLRCSGRFTYMAKPESSEFDTEIEELRFADATKNAFTYEEFGAELDPEPNWRLLHLQPLKGMKESIVLMIRVQ